MSATLDVVSNFSMTFLENTLAGQQGVPGAGAAATDPFQLTVNGQSQRTPFSLATATALKIWDTSVNVPATFQFLHFVADRDFYVQFITSATNFIVTVIAGVPFVMSSPSILAAAATTAMSGSAPSVASIQKIYIQQNSGSTANGIISIID